MVDQLIAIEHTLNGIEHYLSFTGVSILIAGVGITLAIVLFRSK